LTLEDTGGGFHLVGVSLGCGAGSRGRRRARRDRRRATGGVVDGAGASLVATGRTGTGTMAAAGARLRVVARTGFTRVGVRDGQCSDRSLVDDVRIRDLGVRWG
jgi:hypothetical protein